MHGQSLKAVSDDELLRRLASLLKDSRRIEADLVAHIAEVDTRKLYAREAAPSMFAYCTEVLHLSEPEAALRIRVARTSRRHPRVLGMLREGTIHLSGAALLAPLLTRENRDALLKRATHRSKREIQRLVAELAPRPEVAATMRKLPGRRDEVRTTDGRPAAGPTRPLLTGLTPGSPTAGDRANAAGEAGPGTVHGGTAQQRPDAVPTPRRRAKVEPLTRASYKVTFTASAELYDKLERLQALTRSSVPDGDLGKVIELAVTRELGRLEARRFGTTKRPRKTLADADTRPRTRHIPAPVRRAAQERDGGQCTYRDRRGRRCGRRHDLEFHHRDPFGRGGDHRPENVVLMCKMHNGLMAERDYGKEVMERFTGSADGEAGMDGIAGSPPVATPPRRGRGPHGAERTARGGPAIAGPRPPAHP